MEGKIEGSLAPTQNPLSLFEFKTKFTSHMQKCAISKLNFENRIGSPELKNNHDALIELHEQMIATINEHVAIYQEQFKEAEHYEHDKDELQRRVTTQIDRQNKYLEKLQLQLPQIHSLKFLFSLNPSELFQEAIKNKHSVLLITQTPELIAKIANYQITHITHQDREIVHSLASILATREYTFETPNIFAALKQQVQDEADTQFIAAKENEAINHLLLQIKRYLDKKIDKALEGNSNPWALGYFGSNHKVNRGDKKVPVPQGVYELKGHLDQLGTLTPIEVLTKMQNTLHIKNVENKDESLFKQFKRLISYLFGYSQSQETTKEYEFLEQVTAGKQSIP
ncbi:Uncharacterised protein [Legionella steigerwaltii]|uniref:Uncharacterized protein n=1 Tax=Legionella steigerwaltii TaxID=460 RepID=A0A378L6A4_9GAMM|nr:hypothetical protein [Legionella steigerwaltii]KTD77367.1 hypothetical protein Lstg_1724 [Legionella steigerwaltii]STY22247.1 Uncharacterised protein [Legionella steigerwaltii]